MNKIGILEKIKDINYRKEFLKYKESRIFDEKIKKLTEKYILSDKCFNDITRLQDGDYYFNIPIRKAVPKSCSNKKRIIYIFKDEEVALLRLIAYALQDIDYPFIDSLYSFRKGKSAKDYFKWYKDNIPSKGTYAVKTDITSYGGTMDTEILVNKIKDVFKEDIEISNFIVWLISRKEVIDHKEIIQLDTTGLPGCPIHSFFSNIYLDEVDKIFESKCISYARFSDDILMYVDSKEKAIEYLSLLKTSVSNLKLTLNEDKTGIFSSDDSIDFLGMKINRSGIDVASTSVYKLKRKMRIRAKKLAKKRRIDNLSVDEAGKILIDRNMRTFLGIDGNERMSWIRWAFPIITKTDGLKELDLYNQRCIRYAMSDKWSKSQYKVTYQKLKELGYESLVRKYYSFIENQDVK